MQGGRWGSQPSTRLQAHHPRRLTPQPHTALHLSTLPLLQLWAACPFQGLAGGSLADFELSLMMRVSHTCPSPTSTPVSLATPLGPLIVHTGCRYPQAPQVQLSPAHAALPPKSLCSLHARRQARCHLDLDTEAGHPHGNGFLHLGLLTSFSHPRGCG